MQTATKHRTSSLLLARCQYPIRWHKGKGSWTAWPVGLPVTAMDTTKEKTRRRLYRAIQSHLECLIERKIPLPNPPRQRTTQTKQFIIGVERALRRAAKTARKIARTHHTPLYIWRNGKVVATKP